LSHRPVKPGSAGYVLVRPRGRGRGVDLLGLLFGLVAQPGTTGGTDGATDDRARRTGHDTARKGTQCGATKCTGPGAGLIVALSGFARDRTGNSADAAAHGRADGAADRHAYGCATERTGTSADRLRAAFLVLDGRAVRVDIEVIVRVCVVSDGVVIVVHVASWSLRAGRQVAGDGIVARRRRFRP
jgi:hypothetical protein